MVNKPTSEVVACVVDHGLFLPWSQRLAREFKTVYYHTPVEKAFPKLADSIVGDGFSDIIRCDDPFDIMDEVDLWVFPDIGFSGLQLHLEKLGKPVWGSRDADSLEIHREKFLDMLGKVGLSVPPHTRVKGVAAMAEYLKDKEDKWIKMSKYRGDFETFHWRNAKQDSGWLAFLRVKFGPLADAIPFVIADTIETEIEGGYDGYNVDGLFPKLAVHGIECKDRGYLCAVQEYDSLPEQVRKVNEAVAPILRERRYRNKFSTEIRITEDDFFYIDCTHRNGSPPSQCEAELFSNWGDIVWHGAHGELVEPIPVFKYAVQTVLNLKREATTWASAPFPDELRQWVKCGNCCEYDGQLVFPPQDEPDPMIGWLVAGGDTLDEAIDTLKERVEELPDGVTTDINSLVELIGEMKAAEEMDIHYGNEEIPDGKGIVET